MAFRNLRNLVLFNCAFLMGREFIPDPRDTLNIETTSICNLKCRFCAYRKKKSPKVSMTTIFFADCVEQAVAIGFRKFHLTPITGEVFMEPAFFDKLDFLERHAGVQEYSFFSNLTVPSLDKIERLVGLRKLARLTVSVYGHDLNSFIAVTQSNEPTYHRLVENLRTLHHHLAKFPGTVEIGWRSFHSIPKKAKSEMLEALQLFRSSGIRVRRSQVYNNWGGYVTGEDVRGLDIDINDSDIIYKKGACTMLFNSVMIMATGIVNGCACRDVDATLQIGDLHRQPLAQILSSRNQIYMELIENQQKGNFPPVCRCCDFYKSIYRLRLSSPGKTEPLTLRDFRAAISCETSSLKGSGFSGMD